MADEEKKESPYAIVTPPRAPSPFSERYRGKVILAPMVRIGTLPMRLLALDYGADLVYSEELIDFKLLKCIRFENSVLGTVDFIDEDNTIVFRTCPQEKERVILQMGTSDSDRALRAARLVEKDVSGIDINMGCPKEFSLKGGMGAALLTQPEKIRTILTTLVTNLRIPVTCKIRVLPDENETIELAKMIEATGVAALAVHGRNKHERQQHKNRNHIIRAIAKALTIPVIANGGSGEISKFSDIEAFRRDTNASSVMIARSAEHNVSIFRKDGLLPFDGFARPYIKYCVLFDNNITNTKYCIQQMLGHLQDTERGRKFLASQQIKEICVLWDLVDYYDLINGRRKVEAENYALREREMRQNNNEPEQINKRIKLMAEAEGGTEEETVEMSLRFVRNLFKHDTLPKSILLEWGKKRGWEMPKYTTFQVEKHFYSVALVNGKRYRNCYLEKNKKSAEQGVALAAAYALDIVDKERFSDCFVVEAPHERTLKCFTSKANTRQV